MPHTLLVVHDRAHRPGALELGFALARVTGKNTVSGDR